MNDITIGAKRYREFRSSVFSEAESTSLLEQSPVTRAEAGSGLSELEIQARWYAGEYGRDFVTTDGEPIEIVQFGHWNHSAGPDFTECAIKIGGETRGGSIEVDQEPGFWEAHGHGANPAFDETVLHVFLREPEGGRFFTRTSKHRAVPQISIAPDLLIGDTRALWGTLPEAKRGRCATPLAELSEDRLATLLEAASQYRLSRKARRHSRISETHNIDQALFQGVAEAFGYRHNKLAMSILAQRLPMKQLQGETALSREAMLFGLSGFLDYEHFQAGDDDARTYLKSLWDVWWSLSGEMKLDESRSLEWRLSGTRPTNHPQRRLGALAALVNDWRAFCRRIPKSGDPIDRDWVKPFRDYLSQLSHEYWNHHYTLRSKPSAKSLALIGRDRIHDLLGNIIFPMVIADHPDEWARYAKLPGSMVNEKLRRAAIRLFGEKDSPLAKQALKSFAHQQALLQIYADFCLEDFSECSDCPFPEQLRQWT